MAIVGRCFPIIDTPRLSVIALLEIYVLFTV
jgi:hypothetical protein